MIEISIGKTIEWWFGGNMQQGIQGCLLELVAKPLFHMPHSWKQTLHTSYADKENQKQVKQVNTVGIKLFHSIVMLEIIP